MGPPSYGSASRLRDNRARAARLKPEDCLPLKDPVRRLYLIDNRSTNDIAHILGQELGVRITEKQVIHLINKVWCFRKRLKPADLQYINYRKKKRLDAGRFDTRVKLCGIVQNESGLDRKQSRVYESTFDKHAKAHIFDMASPVPPQGLEVGTPTPRPMSESSPVAHVFRRPSRHISIPVYCMPSNLYEGLPSLKLEIVFQNIVTKLQGAPIPVSSSPGTLLPISKISAILSPPGVHENDLSVGQMVSPEVLFSDEKFLEVLHPLMVKFSNRSDSPRALREALDNFTGSVIPPPFYSILKSFFSNITPMIDDFAIQTFHSAARTGNLNLLKLFIELGILKTSWRSRWGSHAHIIGVTALQFSIEYRQGPSTSLLLHNDIHVNVQPTSDLSQSILKTAVEVQDPELVNRLLDIGAKDMVFKTEYSFDKTRDDYLKELCSNGLTWATEIRRIESQYAGFIFTALESATLLGNDNIFKEMLQNRVKSKEKGEEPIIFDSLLHLTALGLIHLEKTGIVVDRLESVLKCGALNIDINGSNISGENALELLETDGEQDDLVKLLVQHGATRPRWYENVAVDTRPQTKAPPICENLCLHKLSKTQFLTVLEILQYSTPSSFSWAPYRHFLESISHLHTTISFKLSSTAVSSIQRTYFEGKFKMFLEYSNHNLNTLESVKTISEDLPVTWINAKGATMCTLKFRFFSTEKAPVKGLKLRHGGLEVAKTPQIDRSSQLDNLLNFKNEDEVLEVLKERLTLNTPGHFRDISMKTLHWARQAGNPEFRQQVIGLYADLIPEMRETQLISFLALSVRSNSHNTIRDIIRYSQGMDKISALEATWNGDNATFDLILEFAQHTNGLVVPLEILVSIAVCIGHTYKVVRLLEQEGVDVNHVLEGGTTFIEMAAALGRLDIAQVLLDAGASHRLLEAKAKAETSGHFVLSDLIEGQIQRFRSDDNMVAPLDLSTATAIKHSAFLDIAPPAPTAVESPGGPIVYEYDSFPPSPTTVLSPESYASWSFLN
ncbi:hypothetical protein TWF481_010034 [Arthrobotrys musiformis]|uniref:Clr5 domain-containing protein n=1 Tax=Arthrobotrys musiformis TaxID=47236 RepID=A0AAV9W1P1_9PEZI